MVEFDVKPYGRAWAVFRGGKAVSAASPTQSAAITAALALARIQWEAGGLARVSSEDEDGERVLVAAFGDRRDPRRRPGLA